MNILKLEQSGFIIETSKGFRLAIDIGNKTPLESLILTPKVDAFLVSHKHGDHFDLERIQKLNPEKIYLNSECRNLIQDSEVEERIVTIESNTEIDIDNIKVTIFDVDHGPNASGPLVNFGFLLEVDNQKVYFAGDMFYESGIDVSNLEIDCALIPIGGFYTFSPEEAFKFAKKFKKIKNIIPMHYEKTPETLEEFRELSVGYFNIG